MRAVSLLLLQARRPTDQVLTEERESFAAALGLPVGEVAPWNVVEKGAPSLAQARRHDALLVGGSGDFLVSSRDMPYIGELFAFLGDVVAGALPMFASCFGFQCLVEALGGRIVYDPEAAEVGTFDVELTEAGRGDRLFGRLPRVFPAQLGRKDRAELLPNGVVNLAASERSPSQALRVDGKPVWASQFHPELTEATNRHRFYSYMKNYQSVMAPGALRDIAAGFRPSPEASSLLREFVRALPELKSRR
jgi:GMP synthase (glutamine-hydrolysing)